MGDSASVQAASDRDRFTSLYPGLRRFAAVVSPAEVDPDDLLQEALSRTLAAGSLERIDHLEAYLRTAMTNLASNHRRHLGRRRRAVQRLHASATDEAALDIYPSDLTALLALAPIQRAVLYLHEVEGFSHRDIAAELGLTEAAARMTLSRARRELRASWEEPR